MRTCGGGNGMNIAGDSHRDPSPIVNLPQKHGELRKMKNKPAEEQARQNLESVI